MDLKSSIGLKLQELTTKLDSSKTLLSPKSTKKCGSQETERRAPWENCFHIEELPVLNRTSSYSGDPRKEQQTKKESTITHITLNSIIAA